MSPEQRVLAAGCALVVLLLTVQWKDWRLGNFRWFRRLVGGRWTCLRTGEVEDYRTSEDLTMSKDWRTQMRRQG